MPIKSYISLFVFLVTLFAVPLSSAIDEGAEQAVDVRLLIDVSGSMKRNDPNNLRQPAVELLVELLPEKSTAGVWTFGKWVNMLIKHRDVDQSWRAMARDEAQNINSVGLYTNIGTALEKAAYDIAYTDPKQAKHIILLTDGMVDIDKDPVLNKNEWRRIVDQVIPKLATAGYRVHTIALSKNADRDLMNKLSVATDGLADVANTADDLMQIFLKAFDVAAPSEQVALSDNQFVVDSSVEEFTALIFRENPEQLLVLVSPDKQRLQAQTNDQDLRWFRADNYDLITVKRPLEGSWTIDGDIAAQSRITVVSNLNLVMAPLPTNLISGAELSVNALLKEDGQVISNADFLKLMTVTASLSGGHAFNSLVSIWDGELAQAPGLGRYQIDLPRFDNEGVYELILTVDGTTFQRQLKHQMTLRQPFSADIREFFRDGANRYMITVNAFHAELDYPTVDIVASIAGPDLSKFTRSLSFTDTDNWQTEFSPAAEGKYVVNLRAKASSKDGKAMDFNLPELEFTYSIEGGLVEQEKPFVEPSPEPTAEPKVEIATEELGADVSPKAAAEPVAPALPKWVIYVALGLGNLMVLGLGVFAFKKIMGGPKADIMDELEQAQKATEPEPAAEPEPAPDVSEEEPPMEDLEPDSPEPTEEAEPPMDVMDMGGVESEPEPEMESRAELDMPDEPAMDDLDAMAMPDGDDKLAASEDDDDMVKAMLEAQGLDLAEEELDDAISSLIDDLEDDDDDDDPRKN